MPTEHFTEEKFKTLSQALISNNNQDAQPIIEEIEAEAISSNPNQINVTLFTAYMHARGGDLVAASMFIKEMIKNDPNIKITWVVKRDIEGHDTDIKQKFLKDIPAKNIELITINSNDYTEVNIQGGKVYKKSDTSKTKPLTAQELDTMSDLNWKGTGPHYSDGGWPELQTKIKTDKEFCYKMAATHMFTVVPNLHRFEERDRKTFTTLNKPFIAISEYDFTAPFNNTLPTIQNIQNFPKKYELGFGKGTQGVYIDDSMLSTKTIKDMPADDAKFKNFLTGNQENYQDTHSLYYGYFFVKDPNPPESDTSTVKLEEFVKNCIINALNDPTTKDNIDIVLPITDPNKLQKIWDKISTELSIEHKKK